VVLATTTTVFLVAEASVAGATVTWNGSISVSVVNVTGITAVRIG
jgi:hypothetical protein